MKKALYIFAAAVVSLATSCQKEQPTPAVTPADKDLVTYTFTTSAEEVKSTLTGGGIFSWELNDEIAIWNTTGEEYVTFTVTSVDNSGVATISADGPLDATWSYAIYPASRAAGSGNAVDYSKTGAKSGPILVSEVTDNNILFFKYLGAVMNVSVSNVPGVNANTVLKVTANANVFGTRTFSWSGEGDNRVPALASDGTQASVTVPFTNGTVLSIPVPNANYEGFTITVDDENGKHLYKKTTSSTFDLSSKKLLNMQALTYAAPEIYYMRTTDTKGGNFWSCDIPLLKTGADAHYALANVDKTATYVIFDEYNKVDPGTAVPSAAILKSGNVLDLTYTTNTFSLIGDVNSWAIENTSYAFNKIGDWNYILNQSGLHNKAFKFNPWGNTTADNWGPVWGSYDGKWFTDSVKEVTIGEGTSYGNCGLYFANTTVNIFLNTSTSKAYYREASDKNNPISALVAFTYTPSTNTLSTSTEDEWGVVNPFNDTAFPTDTYYMYIQTDNQRHLMTYNGNWGWSINITVENSGTYSFHFDKGNDGNYWTALSTTWDTVNVGENGYGRLAYWDESGEPSVTLPKGSYKVFVNPTYAYNHSLNVQFVKQ